jgi:hypothetical protein
MFIDHWGIPCYQTNLAPQPNAWSFACFVDDGNGQTTLYANGAMTTNTGATYSYPLSMVTIGSSTIGGTTTTSAFIGSIDDASIWENALDETSLDSLWNRGLGCVL